MSRSSPEETQPLLSAPAFEADFPNLVSVDGCLSLRLLFPKQISGRMARLVIQCASDRMAFGRTVTYTRTRDLAKVLPYVLY
jgi:hypothetical protein